MRRRAMRPYGASVGPMRVLSLLMAVGLLYMLYDRFKDPATWRWLTSERPAEEVVDAGAPKAGAPATEPEELVVPGPNDLDEQEVKEVAAAFEAVHDRTALQGREMPAYWQLVKWSRTQTFAELSERCYGGIDYPAIGEHAALPPRTTEVEVPPAPKPRRAAKGKGLRLLTYRPLFSGPAVERVPELQFQRPGREIELSPDDAQRLRVDSGATVQVRSNGTSVELRARVNKKLVKGVARVPVEHASELGTHVEVAT